MNNACYVGNCASYLDPECVIPDFPPNPDDACDNYCQLCDQAGSCQDICPGECQICVDGHCEELSLSDEVYRVDIINPTFPADPFCGNVAYEPECATWVGCVSHGWVTAKYRKCAFPHAAVVDCAVSDGMEIPATCNLKCEDGGMCSPELAESMAWAKLAECAAANGVPAPSQSLGGGSFLLIPDSKEHCCTE
jgi:hypothetical protein